MTNTFAVPMSGTYNYRTRNFDGTFNLFQIPCLVLGETAASYIISTMRELCGLPKGHRMTVRKHNVFLKDAGASTSPATDKDNNIDYSNAWWHE
ncbi:MAG: hypothetical protein IKQ94_04395 [Bacteroidales bacterium]|nr:hypothetical protein [Bacteroidales bacterium]